MLCSIKFSKNSKRPQKEIELINDIRLFKCIYLPFKLLGLDQNKEISMCLNSKEKS